jgi:4-hydroxy-3-methylbut-2-enyl diphosphate reductase
MAIAARCDAILVIGSANSSNTNALAKLATEAGCPRVLRINGPDELSDDLVGTVGVTAGASAPDDVVAAVISSLDPGQGVEEVRITDEDEYFAPPRDIRDLLGALDVATTVGLGGDLSTRPELDDRHINATDVLLKL